MRDEIGYKMTFRPQLVFLTMFHANLQKFSQTTSAGFSLSSYSIGLQTVDQGTPQMHASARALH